MNILLFLFFSIPGIAEGSHHINPVYAPQATMHMEGDRLHLEIVGHAFNWKESVLGERPPAGEWPDPLKDRARDYMERRFPIEADGRAVAPRLVRARMTEWPWQNPWKARVRLRLVYDMPPGTRVVAGRIEMYRKDFDARPVTDGGKALGLPMEFWTDLRLSGRVAEKRRIEIWNPSFSFPVQDLQRTWFQRSRAAFGQGFLSFLSGGSRLTLAVAALLAFPAGATAAGGAAAALFFGMGCLPLTKDLAIGVWILAGAVCGLSWAGRRARAGWTFLVPAGSAVAGLAFAADLASLRLALASSAISRPFFLAGGILALGTVLGLALAVQWALDLQIRHMDAAAQESSRLFRRRLASALLLALSLSQIIN